MIRDLIYYGNPLLRKKCKEVAEINDEVRRVVQDLIDTVLAKDGAGLSAPQIGHLLRIFVSRYENGADQEGWPITCTPKVYINPVLSNPSSTKLSIGEGCLSIPGVSGKVIRPDTIDVEAMDLDGKIFTEKTTGWRARTIMHENDHLNGVLYIDRMSPRDKKQLDPALKRVKKKFTSTSSQGKGRK